MLEGTEAWPLLIHFDPAYKLLLLMYISILLQLIKTHIQTFFFTFYEKVGIVGGFEEKVGKSRIKTKK